MNWKSRRRTFSLAKPSQRQEIASFLVVKDEDHATIVKSLPENIPAPVQEGLVRRMNNYIDLVEIRQRDIEGTQGTPAFLEGEDKWIWIKEDQGAWSGPADDWATSHRFKFFKYLKKQDIIVTAGANQGMYVRFYAKAFGTVYAFEPDPLNFHCMSINNQVDNVIKLQMALGAENRLIKIERNGFTNTGCWSINREAAGIVPQITLDSLNLPGLDFLQLDVEGYEIRALEGAKQTINKFRPIIAAENGTTPEITAFMADQNYQNVDQSVADTIWAPK